MKSDNPVQTKSCAFGLRIVKLFRHLSDEKKEFDLSKQIFRGGAWISAKVDEGALTTF